MAKKELDTTGLRCPQPILKIAVMMRQISRGDVLEVKADCETFEADIRKWSERMGKSLILLVKKGTVVTAQIQF